MSRPPVKCGVRASAMKSKGTVQSHTSGQNARKSGPPGEAEILRLNSGREARLRQAMGWTAVEPGTLNLAVPTDVVERLLEVAPAVIEEPGEVTYPSPYEAIPQRREGYLYYRGDMRSSSQAVTVLVRRARNPIKGRLEVFAESRLRDSLNLCDGDVVNVEIYSAN